MFIFIQNDLINVNHIVSCASGSGVTLVILDNGRRLTMPAADFEANVLPSLPMLRARVKELPILPPEEVQVGPAETAEAPAETPVETSKATRSRSRKTA